MASLPIEQLLTIAAPAGGLDALPARAGGDFTAALESAVDEHRIAPPTDERSTNNAPDKPAAPVDGAELSAKDDQIDADADADVEDAETEAKDGDADESTGENSSDEESTIQDETQHRDEVVITEPAAEAVAETLIATPVGAVEEDSSVTSTVKDNTKHTENRANQDEPTEAKSPPGRADSAELREQKPDEPPRRETVDADKPGGRERGDHGDGDGEFVPLVKSRSGRGAEGGDLAGDRAGDGVDDGVRPTEPRRLATTGNVAQATKAAISETQAPAENQSAGADRGAVLGDHATGREDSSHTDKTAKAAMPTAPTLSRVATPRGIHPAAAQVEADSAPAVDRPRFVQRVSGAVEAAQRRDGRIQVRMSPPELGSLRIELVVRQGTLTASLETENFAARQVLLDNLPALRARLAEQDIRVEQFDVDVRRDGNGANNGGFGEEGPNDRQPHESRQRRHSSQTPAVEDSRDENAAEELTAAAPNSVEQNLDIRV